MGKRIRSILTLTVLAVAPLAAATTLIRNVTIYLPTESYQTDSFVLIDGAKIRAVGRMADVPAGIYDHEYDLKGCTVYPAFIDPCYTGFQGGKEKEAAPAPPTDDAVDKTIRPPAEKRNHFIRRRLADELQLNGDEARKLIAQGFAAVQVVPQQGIIGGTSAVISLGGDTPARAVLEESRFLCLTLTPNPQLYPTTYAGLAAEWRQWRLDAAWYAEYRRLQANDPRARAEWRPELTILLDVFRGRLPLLIRAASLTEQSLAETLSRDITPVPVLVLNADCWRRAIPADAAFILPLSLEPVKDNRYAIQGETVKKQVAETLYPEKLAALVNGHPHISLTAPQPGDYAALFANLRRIVQKGAREEIVLRALTVNPARLLAVADRMGAVAPGKLANIVVCDGRILQEKRHIAKVWVEGRLFEFPPPDEAAKKSGGPK